MGTNTSEARRGLAIGLLVAALVATSAAVPPHAEAVIAAPISVNTLADSVADDGACSLREAVAAANADTASGAAPGECAAGAGVDTIVFTVSGVITLGTSLPTITTAMTIDGGGAIAVDGAHKGTIFRVNAGAALTLDGIELRNGSGSNGYGGAIYDLGTLTLVDSAVFGSIAQYGGGAITVTGAAAAATIDRTTLADNAAGYGAAVSVYQGTLSVHDSTLRANATSGTGGAISSGEAVVTVSNSTLVGNSSSDSGGAIEIVRGTLNLTNDTITGNATAPAFVGGGLFIYPGTTAVVKNTIVAGNSAGSDSDVWGTIGTSVSNIVGGPVDTLLGVLGDHGGPTQTIPLLPTAAAAIGQGDPTACAAAPVSSLDQRGVARPAACAIGAFELDTTPPTASAPTSALRMGTPLAGSAIPVRVAWKGADNAGGSGLDHFDLEVKVDAGGYTAKTVGKATSLDIALAPGKTYRWRVRAVDVDGNASAWAYGAESALALVQQTATAVKYSTGWGSSSSVKFSGGSVKSSSRAGAWATYTVTAHAVALVLTTARTRGKVKVYVDGKYAVTLDLGTATTVYRALTWQRVWSRVGTHTIKLVVVGTPGRPRVDVDAFVRVK